MLVIKRNGITGVIANAEAQLIAVQVFHSQAVVQRVVFQSEGGHQAEFIGESRQSLGAAAQFQHQGIFGLVNEIMLHIPGKAVHGRFVDFTLGLQLAIHQLAAVGEQDGSVEFPDRGITVPDMFNTIALADYALHLGTPGGNGNLQVFILNNIFHSVSPPSERLGKISSGRR